MHFKITTERLFIIIFINNVLLTCGLRKDATLMELPATLEQMKDLASSVCFDMFLDSAAAARCMENFQSHRYETNKEPPSVEIKCQSENKVTFAVPQSKDWQLVVVILNEDDNSDYLFFNLMEPAKEIGSIYTPLENFTFWTALLNDVGSPSLWKKGPVIEPWKSSIAYLERKMYVVKTAFQFDKYDNETEEIDAEISWNATDSTDSCFEVFNRCNKNALGNVLNKKIRPDQNRSIVAKVPLDDKCTVIVKGKYGTAEFIYNTPSCYDLPGCKSVPEMVKDLILEAEEDSDSNWIVHAKWKRPLHPPSYYTAILRADAVYTANVSGASTEVVFNDVQGEGLYNVTVVASNAYGYAVSTRRDIFPMLEESAAMSLFVGAWGAVLVLTSTFAIILVWWKRQRDIKKRNMYFPGIREKISKDDEMEVNVESGSEDQWEVKPERLLLHEVIGEGAFGVVRRGTLAPDNKDVAVKMLKDFPSMEEIRSFRAEMELMKSVGSHPHVVSLVGCFRGRKPFIVAEYCSRGDLLSYLRCSWDLMVTRRNAKYDNNNEELDYCEDLKCKRDSRLVINRLYDLQGICDAELTVLDLLSFCRQIAMGMEFLASNRVVHRDLAARNILVSADRTLKIADFGLSRDIYQENQYKQKGNGKMPVKWMALESLTHRVYTTQSDVWSFGVVMWEIVTVGGAPYPAVGAARLPRLLRAGYRMPRPPNCSTQLYELMLSCWHERPRSRPTFGELHRALDSLLCASAHHYLDLQLPPDACAPHPRPHRAPQRYVHMIIRGEWPWSNRGYQSSYTTNYTPRTQYKLGDSLQNH